MHTGRNRIPRAEFGLVPYEGNAYIQISERAPGFRFRKERLLCAGASQQLRKTANGTAVPKITLVNPKSDSAAWGIANHPKAMDQALVRHGLTHLSAVLKAAGHEVTLVDLRRLSGWLDYEECLRNSKADFVCVTAHTMESGIALEALNRAKRTLADCITVAGGIHWTMFVVQGRRIANLYDS